MKVDSATFADRVDAETAALSEWRVLVLRISERLGVSEEVALGYYTLARLDMCLARLDLLAGGGDQEGWR